MNNTATTATARNAEHIEADLEAFGFNEPYAYCGRAEFNAEYYGQLRAFGDGTGREVAVANERWFKQVDALLLELRRCPQFGPFLPEVWDYDNEPF